MLLAAMTSQKSATVKIVALGDSTTAGTPGFKSPLEAPPNGRGDETSQYAYWLMGDIYARTWIASPPTIPGPQNQSM